MGWLLSIFLVIVGALGAYPQIVQARPDAKRFLDMLLPYQAIIGIAAVVLGLLAALHLLGNMGVMAQFAPIIWIVSLAGSILAILLGLLLGYGLIAQHVLGGNTDFQRRGEALRARLVRRQGALGIAAIAVGLVAFLMFLVR